MGLDMRTKRILLEETAKRYCWASKKEKTKIIDEFTATTGYNRKYAIHVLKNKAVLQLFFFILYLFDFLALYFFAELRTESSNSSTVLPLGTLTC
ncbi:MAG: hypothetical protein P1P63_09485 [Treponemataceae bacterium]